MGRARNDDRRCGVALSAILCAIIAQSKGLNVGSWALGGLVFGIFAVVVVALTRPAGEARLIQVDCPTCKKPGKAMSNATVYDCRSCGAHFEQEAAAS